MSQPDQRPRLVYLGRFKLPEGNAATQRVLGISKSLRALNIDVSLVGLAEAGSPTGVTEVDGFRALALEEKSLRDLLRGRFGYSWIKAAEQHFGPFDGAIFYNFPAHALASSTRRLRHQRRFALADITEWYALPRTASPGAWFLALDNVASNRFSAARLDGVIAISHWLQERCSGRQNTVRVPPTIDLADPKWIHARPNNSDQLRLVYAGNPGSAKDDLASVLRACEAVRSDIPIRLDIFGLTEPEFRKAQSVKGEFTTDIHFHGRVPQSVALAGLAAAEYSIFPREPTRQNIAGFPTKLVEATTLGVGIITTPVGDSGRLDDIPNLVLAADCDVSSLSDAIRRAYRERTSITHAENPKFSYTQVTDEIEEFLIRAGLGMETGS